MNTTAVETSMNQSSTSVTGSSQYGNFTMTVPLAKSWQDETQALRFEGVASSTSLDRQAERLTIAAMEKMRRYEGLDLLPSHKAGALEELGTIDHCWIDNSQLRIEGSLEPANPKALLLFKRLQEGHEYGLSIGGTVLRAHWEEDRELGRAVKYIDDVVLDHVAVCRSGHAANPDTYLCALAKAANFVLNEDEAEDATTIDAPLSGNAIVEALRNVWPFGARTPKHLTKSKDNAEQPPPEAEMGTEAEFADLHAQIAALTATVNDLRENLEKETAPANVPEPGRPQSIPGQRTYVTNNTVTWKGVL